MDVSKTQDQVKQVVGKAANKVAGEKTRFTSDPSMFKDRLTMEPPPPFRADEATIAMAGAGAGFDSTGSLP